MEYPYKISIHSNQINKDYIIPPEKLIMKLGNTPKCEARFSKDYFDDRQIEIDFIRTGEGWIAGIGEGLYVKNIHNTITGKAKNTNIRIRNFNAECGDVFDVFEEISDTKLFEITIAVDFTVSIPQINNYISIEDRKSISVSCDEGADLIITSPLGKGNEIIIADNGTNIVLVINKAPFGVFINGEEIKGKKVLSEYDYIAFCDIALFIKEGNIYFDKDKIRSSTLDVKIVQNEGVFKYPAFIRNTRIKKKINEEKIKILDPANKPEKPEKNIVMRLLPAIVMLGLCVVFRVLMNPSKNTFVLFSICSMGIGIVTTIGSIVREKRKYKNSIKSRRENYIRYIEEKRASISEIRQSELEALRDRYFSNKENLQHILSFDTCLFDRDKNDEDFMDIYFGTGQRKAIRAIDYKEKEQLTEGDKLTKMPMELSALFEYIDDAPVTLGIKDAGAIGITGNKETLFNIFKNIIVDICARQYYTDVKIVCLIDEDNYKSKRADFLKYLPHIKVDNIGDNTQRLVVVDEESKTFVFEYLYKILSSREHGKESAPHYVILALTDYEIKKHPLMKYVESAAEISVTFIFFEEKVQRLPQYCRYVVEGDEDDTGIIYEASDSENKTNFEYSVISDKEMMDMAIKLAPVYAEEISLAGTLRKKISLFELYGIYEINDLDIRKNWSSAKICESMAVPIGINSKEETVCLDLHEKHHGPHGLVAGTTGSGKSEILQSYILGAAMSFSPEEIGFLIIDFKGGGMANQFSKLPHLLGTITNLEGKEVDRSLKSIKAELVKRQNYFSESGVNHIDNYIELYKSGKVSEPLPHLIIIVDEFAELKAEQPEFMKELISAARIGRSLGVHLILATQKPSGQVNEQIWSNSRFKLCLKVQNQADSNEVLKSPLAAEIREPGRAYLQVGNNEIFELFQSGYSGEAEKQTSKDEHTFKMYELDFKGNKTAIYEKKTDASESSKTQLEAVIDHIFEYCKENGINRLKPICMPSLPDELVYERKEYHHGIAIGLYDAPERQQQIDYYLDIFGANTFIIGSSGMGKTILIQNIIRGISDNFTPEEVNIYICDFGSMYLKNIEPLNTVGGVITIDNDEKFKNLVKLLQSEMNLRKEKLALSGVSTLDTYINGGNNDIARITVIIDNFALYKEVYESNYGDTLLQIIRDGISLGITFVVTNTQINGIGYKYLPNFANRISFRLGDNSGYTGFFERCRMTPKEIPGRAICVIDKEAYEMQIMMPFTGDTEIERTGEIRSYISEYNSRFKKKARKIPEIPEKLTADMISDICGSSSFDGTIPIGIDYDSMKLISYSLSKNNEISIFGDEIEKKENICKNIISLLGELYEWDKTKIYLIDDAEKNFRALADIVDKYTDNGESIIEIFDHIYEEMKKRYDNYLTDVEKISYFDSPYVLIVNNQESVELLCSSKERLAGYKEMMKKYRKMGLYVIFTFPEDAPIPYGSCEIIKGIKERKSAISTTDYAKDIKLFDITSGVAKTLKPLGEDDAYCFQGSNVYKVKLIS